MNASLWERLHGGSTHFPIVLVLASVVFDFIAWRSRDEALQRGLHTAGFGLAGAGALGAIGAVIAGLMITHGRMLGGGYEKLHHLWVWPAFASCIVFVGWRLLRGDRIPHRSLGTYLAGMSVSAALMVGAGYSGGEMLLGAESGNDPAPSSLQPVSTPARAEAGRRLFLKNCAHCHGSDARGDEGPDLHNLDWTDEQIAARIWKGKEGEMTAFAGKFSPEQIRAVVAYLRMLK